MNFTEAINEIIGITKRPDKATEIASALNSAITYFTLKDSWKQDLKELTIAVDSSLYSDTIDLSQYVTRLRKIKYLKVYGVKGYLKEIDTEHVFTPGGYTQKNWFYVIGSDLTYNTSTLGASLELGYYQYPAILSGTSTHWMLDINPWMLIDKAAARIFRSIGDDNSAKLHEGYAFDHFKTLQNDLVQGAIAGV